MSRTYRHMKSSKYRSKELLRDHQYVLKDLGNGYQWREWSIINIHPHSKEGKKILTKFHAKSDSIMVWHGPMWWIRLYTQKPFSMKAKTELHKFLRDPDYEVLIESKPHRSYYW